MRFIVVLLVFCGVAFAQAAKEAQKPLRKTQVQELVAAGVPSEKLARTIEERRIDFNPTDEFLDALRKAGAQEILIKTLIAQKPKPLTKDELLRLIASGAPSRDLCDLVERRGIDFEPTEEVVDSLRIAGADETLIASLPIPKIRNASPPPDFGKDALSISAADVSPPVPVYKPEPPYTKAARKAKLEGTVVFWIVVDEQGNVSDLRQVASRLGKGLDESAAETVRRWKFQPAQRQGVAVPVRVAVDVSFKLFR